MIENFQAIIGAKIRDFQRKMKQVDRQVRETAFEATKPIDADIKDFQTKMAEIQATAKRVLKRGEKNISADISNFMRKAAEVAVVARALMKDKIVIPIQTRWKNYQNVMGRIANFNRSMSEIMQMTAQGITISLSPAIVPIIASLVGLLGQLGPMIGTIGGSTFALGTAFATAGIGAVAFGAIAMTNLKDVFEESKKANDSMNKLKGTWVGIAKSTKTKTVDMFTRALDILNGVLIKVTPMFTSVTDAVGRLVDSLGASVNSKSMTAFFDYLNNSAGPMLETVSKSLGNFMKGFFSMMVAFGPLAESTSAGFLKMSDGFATWAAGLSESKKFQAFVDYVNENMPKIRAIFRDAFVGIINTFAAFGPSSSDMMTSLQDMMARFKEWSSALSENQGFQNFIKYIKENGPKVVDLIGKITTFLVNLGIALAPMGSFMLDIINRFLEWSSAMLENHPWIGKIAAVVLVLGGAFLAALPHIIGMIALFGGLSSPMVLASARMVATAATFIGKWTLMGVKATASALKQAAAWTLSTGAAMVTSVGAMIATSVTFVAKWTLIGLKATANAVKVAAAWALSTGAAMVTSLASMIATSTVFVAKWLWMGVQSLLHAAKMAAAWFIALGPVGWVIAAIVGLAILIIANWDKIKKKTSEIWKKISNAVKDAWKKVKEKTVEAVVELGKNIAKMPGKVSEFVGKMKQAGADLIGGVIKGITGKIGEGLSAIGGFAKGLLARFKKDTATKSPSRAFADISKWFAPGIVKGIDKTSHLAINSVSDMSSRLTGAFSPQLAMADMQANATLNTSIKRSDMKAVQHSFAADLDKFEIPEKSVNIHIEGDAEWIRAYVNDENAVKSALNEF